MEQLKNLFIVSYQNLIKLPKWSSAKKVSYNIPKFFPVHITKRKDNDIPRIFGDDTSFTLIRKVSSRVNTLELFKTPNPCYHPKLPNSGMLKINLNC